METTGFHNIIIRLVTKYRYLSHTDPLFKRYKILKLKDIHRLKLGLYMYNHNDSPLYFTRFISNLLLAFQRLSFTQKSICFSALRNWNLRNWNSIAVHIKNLLNSSAIKCCH